MNNGRLEFQYILDGLKSGLLPAFDFPAAPPGLNWDTVARILQKGRLASHFYILGVQRRQEWPADFQDTLLRDRISLTFYSNQCSVKVRGVLSALLNAGVQVIVLKGWAYIQTIYQKDSSQRVCEDIDVLVHPKDADAAEKIFADLGMHIEPESWRGYARRYANGTRYFFETFSEVPGSTFSVGLHWGLLHTPSYDPGRIDMDGVFLRAQKLVVEGVSVLQLSPADHIVYACAHAGLHHRFDATVFREYELAHTILHSAFERDEVIGRAIEWKCVLPVRLTFERINELWGGLIADDVIDELSHIRPAFMEKFVMWWMRTFRSSRVFDHVLVWLTFPVWYQRPLIAFQDVFPSLAYMRLRYGNGSKKEGILRLYLIRALRAFKLLLNKSLQR